MTWRSLVTPPSLSATLQLQSFLLVYHDVEEVGQLLSDYTKCTLVASAISLYTECVKTIHDYNTAHPLVE